MVRPACGSAQTPPAAVPQAALMRHTSRDRRNRIRKQKSKKRLRQQAKQRKKQSRAAAG
jgi:hypothetical protein